MPVFRLPPEHIFPDPELARDDGLLAVGGDLHPSRMLLAYARGIFPWYSEGMPILWHAPEQRFVLYLDELKIPRSLKKVIRRAPFRLTMDEAFSQVIEACARTPRPGQDGTWITREMIQAYCMLHEMGFAHSVEAWQGEELVGGLYGVSLGQMFFGESMFTSVSDSAKISFVALARQLQAWGYDMVDSQVYTDHLARFGAREIPRLQYNQLLEDRIWIQGRRGPWRFEEELLSSLPDP